jgi:hypothetical protein
MTAGGGVRPGWSLLDWGRTSSVRSTGGGIEDEPRQFSRPAVDHRVRSPRHHRPWTSAGGAEFLQPLLGSDAVATTASNQKDGKSDLGDGLFDRSTACLNERSIRAGPISATS